MTLNIPKEEQDHYKYVGNNLMYDPPGNKEPQYDKSKMLIEGTGGYLVHPKLRP